MNAETNRLEAIEPFFSDRVSPKRLAFLYQFALATVAVLGLSGQALIQYQIRNQRHDAHVVNLAGRERI